MTGSAGAQAPRHFAARTGTTAFLALLGLLLACLLTSSPATAAPTTGARSTGVGMWTFWAGLGGGVTANCYIVTAAFTTTRAQARCDRYYFTKDGTSTQGATLIIEGGRARRVTPGDATGTGNGRHLRPGDSIHKSRFRCVARRHAFVCRDTHTRHGFRILTDGYETF